MSTAAFNHRLYLVTDEKACLGRNLITVTEEAVKGGVSIVQLREKNLSHRDFLEKAQRLKEMLDRYTIPLIINDNFLIAKECNAAGIHVGSTDIAPVLIKNNLPDRIVGYSIENEAQLYTNNATVADYLGISPVFATPTKTDTITEWRLEGIRKIRSITTKPLIAIGGITKENAAAVIQAGADCLAVVSAICSATYPGRAAENLCKEIERGLTRI